MVIPKNYLEGLYGAHTAKFATYPLHEHDFGEVFWIDQGSGCHLVNGEEILVGAGDFVFIRPTDQHGFKPIRKKSIELKNIAFRWEIYEHIKTRHLRNDGSIYGEERKLPKTIHLTDPQLRQFRQSFLSLFKPNQGLLEIERFLLNVFAELFPEIGSSNPNEPHRQPLPSWLEKARQEIRDPKRLHLGLAEFYRLCCRCPEHVTRVAQRLLNETPGDYIHRLRMEHAAILLASSSKEIIEISLECGFESLSHFYACFRKAHRISPGRYRAQKQTSWYLVGPPKTGPISNGIHSRLPE